MKLALHALFKRTSQITLMPCTQDNGIDKIKSKEDLIQKFSKCINESQARVPHDRKSRCYIFLAATAGMRLLAYEHSKSRSSLMVCSLIHRISCQQGQEQDSFRPNIWLYTGLLRADWLPVQEPKSGTDHQRTRGRLKCLDIGKLFPK